MRKLPLQIPLIWHTYLLQWILGAFFLNWPVPALTGSALLLFADRRCLVPGRFLICILVFLASFAYASHHFTTLESRAASPALQRFFNKGSSSRVCGEIVAVNGMPDRHLRILLKNAHPEKEPNNTLSELCSWSWADPWIMPLPGQEACLKRYISPIFGTSNSGRYSKEISPYARNILWQTWSRESLGKPEFSGEPSFFANLREKLRINFLSALLGPDTPPTTGLDREVYLTEGKSILLGLLFGDRFFISRQTMDNFASAAIAHSLALSGQHLAVAGLIGIAIVLGLGKIHPRIYISRPRRLLAVAASLPFAFVYLWLGNGAPSLLRAAMMLLVLAIFIWRSAIFTGMDLLFMALFLILLINPLAIFDLGLQLSALCIGIITLFAPAMRNFHHVLFTGKNGLLWTIASGAFQILLVSIIIQSVMLPLSLSRFQIAGLWLPVNIIWLPVLGMFVLPLGVAGLILASLPGSIFQHAAWLLLEAASTPCDLLAQLLEVMRTRGLLEEPTFFLPHWTVFPAFAIIAIVCAWFFSHQRTVRIVLKTERILCAALLILATGPFLRIMDALDDKIVFETLDVGQALSILVKWPGGGKMLFDGGGNPLSNYDTGKMLVAPFLLNNSNDTISAVINSHPDLDHLGGLFYVLKKFDVKNVFHNGAEADRKVESLWKETQQEHGAIILREDDKLIIKNGQDENLFLEILNPPPPPEFFEEDTRDMDEKELNKYLYFYSMKGNSASIVARLVWNGVGIALFTGDMEISNMQRILRKKADVSAKVLFAPHHGSDRSFLEKFYKAVNPEVVIISCGMGNRWKHPGPSLKRWLHKEHVPYFDTARSGRITLSVEKNGKIEIDTVK